LIRAQRELILVRLLLLLLLLGPMALGAQEAHPESPPSPGESLRVSLLTIGQGDVVWERFGHNAILIQDEETGWEASYNWGVFSFEWELLALVEENALPENRDYRYDYYGDNCSTRVRDVLDRVLDGQLEALFSADTTAFTYRWHTRRVLRELPAYYLGIQFVLGPTADRPITEWEEMFLPLSLMEGIRAVQLPDGKGGVRSLVTEERVLLDPGRPEPPTSPPFAFPIFLAIGILWGGVLLWLVGSGCGLGVGRRLGVVLLAGGWGRVAALSGSLLLGAWLFTDHVFWYANFNLFQVNPLFFPMPVAFFLFLFMGRLPRWGRKLAFALALISVVGVALQLLPGVDQKNGEMLALSLPMNLALWAGAVRLNRRRREEPTAMEGEAG